MWQDGLFIGHFMIFPQEITIALPKYKMSSYSSLAKT